MNKRNPFMAANWKMNLSLDEAEDLLTKIKTAPIDLNAVDVLVAPPFTTLHLTGRLLAGSGILVGGQNMHWEPKGAFTGEISPLMLKEAGCSHVILGHSERRRLFFETDEIINRKVNAAIGEGLVPILCIGETLEEREQGKTFEVVRSQLHASLKVRGKWSDLSRNVILAYEPVWAIGTGKTATPEQAQEVHYYVRGWLRENLGGDSGDAMRILYGGSVRPDNIKELMVQSDIDGALIGGASLTADSFLSIVRFYEG